jgi:hypothetical protein
LAPLMEPSGRKRPAYRNEARCAFWDGSVSAHRSAPPATTSSSPTTTSSTSASPSANSAPTGSPAATRPSTAPAGSSNNSKRSATQSQSRPPPDQLTQPTSPTPRSSPPPDPLQRGPAWSSPPDNPAGIHTSGGGRRFESVRWFAQKPCTWACCVARCGEIETLRGYETGTFWDWRALAGTRDVSRHGLKRARGTRSRPITRKVPANRQSTLPRWRDADSLLR